MDTVARSRKVSALVLSRRSVGEADRAVTFFTRELGLLRVLAKGVRRIPSRRGGHLEPLTEVAAVVSGRPGRWWLTAAETRDYFGALQREAEALASARVQAAAVMRLLEYEVAYPAVWAALRYSWQQSPTLAAGRCALLEAAVVLFVLRSAGMQPQLAACQRCGQREPREAVVLEAERGGWLCLSCRLAPVVEAGGFTTGQARQTGGPAGGGMPSWRSTAVSLTPQELVYLRLAAVSWGRASRLTLSAAEGQQLVAALRGYLGAVVGLPAVAPVVSRYG